MRIELLTVYERLGAYVDELRAGAEPAAAWERIAVAPFWDKLSCYAPVDMSQRKPKPITDADSLAAQLELLKRVDTAAMLAGFERIASALPPFDDDPIYVAVYPSAASNRTVSERQNGVAGTSVFGNMIISVDPLVPGWEQWLPYVFAHEYHHSVWGAYWFGKHGGELEGEFVESLLIDGEADAFALSQCPGLRPQWLFGMPQEELAALWHSEYAGLVHSKEVDYNKCMFGGGQSGLPWCAGYAIGYAIIARFLRKHPQTGFRALMEMKPADILEAAGTIE